MLYLGDKAKVVNSSKKNVEQSTEGTSTSPVSIPKASKPGFGL
jgi:hypothetical protein